MEQLVKPSLAARLRGARPDFDPRPSLPVDGRPTRVETQVALGKKPPPPPKVDLSQPSLALYEMDLTVYERWLDLERWVYPVGEVQKRARTWVRHVKSPWDRLRGRLGGRWEA